MADPRPPFLSLYKEDARLSKLLMGHGVNAARSARKYDRSCASTASRERHQSPLVWSPDMAEVAEQPPHMILIDNDFAIYRRRRRRLVSAKSQA